jgi:hypothetical protein
MVAEGADGALRDSDFEQRLLQRVADARTRSTRSAMKALDAGLAWNATRTNTPPVRSARAGWTASGGRWDRRITSRVIELLAQLVDRWIVPSPLEDAPEDTIQVSVGQVVGEVDQLAHKVGAFRLHSSRHEVSDLPLDVVLFALAIAAAWLGASLFG